jgi:S-adenosylmethionine synthetase
VEIHTGSIDGASGDLLPVEIVERKGLGHPDSLCDALAEAVSARLCRHYLEHCGVILHHNVDKVLLCGGAAAPRFGGGEVLEPMDIFLGGRATHAFEGACFPVHELAADACRNWIRQNLRAVDPKRDARIHPLIRPGSADLVQLYLRAQRDGVWLANDTSCGVGYAPLSELERLVLNVEQRLTSVAMRATQPALGEDVKVMGIRRDRRIELIVACALIGRFLGGLQHYRDVKAWLVEQIRAAAGEVTGCALEAVVNAADAPDGSSVYLTVTGTSAEAGDDGEAGRGNRVNGLITPYRPMTMESLAGKNPVSHVGKLYNLCAGLLASALTEDVGGVREAHCALVSRIGRPVTEPEVVDVRLRLDPAASLADVAAAVEAIAWRHVEGIPALSSDLLEGRIAPDRWPLRTG